jgi:hypothetical protein
MVAAVLFSMILYTVTFAEPADEMSVQVPADEMSFQMPLAEMSAQAPVQASERLEVLAIFAGCNKQAHPTFTNNADNLDTIWILFTNGEFSQFVVMDGIYQLFSCGTFAFDEEGRRLGMGGGYYDRYLPECVNAYVAAAAYEVQKAEEIPADEYDVPVDAVISEKRIYRTADR